MPLTSLAVLAALMTQPTPAKFNAVQPLPDKPPAWLDGYRLRWPLRVIGDPAKQTAKSVVTSIATGGWLKPDAADLAVQAATGEQLPVAVLSHDPNGETIIQFPRKANDAWYWVYGVHASPKPAVKPPVIQEALTVEVRDWAGDDLKDWASVRNGL